MTKKLIYTSLLALAVSVTGCKKFFDINETPNDPTSVPPSLLLPTGLSGSAFANANELNRFGSTTMDYLTGAANSPQSYDIYVITGADFANQWRFELYGGALISYKKMIETAEANGAKAYAGIGKIMMAYTFAIATDTWGDVPYTEALKGDDGDVIQPSLTPQEQIYKGGTGVTSLFDLVRQGLRDLDTATTSTPTVDDVVYGGNIARWRKAGNTLLLKLALQISKREPALTATVINEVLAKGAANYIVANNEDLAVNFGGSTGSQSPIFFYVNVSSFLNDMLVSTRYVNRLQALNDPRLDKYVTKPTGSLVTVDNGFRGTLPVPTTSWSKWSTVITGANGVGPVRLITNPMRAFILAEAAVSIPGVNLSAADAQALYAEGIRASMTAAGLTTAEIDAYFLANPTVVTLAGTTEQQVEQIITQKYIANTGNGLEAWNDWRRTGYPTLSEHQNAGGEDGTRPKRARYIDQEVARNPAFANAPLTNVPVWWDAN
jgi:hypothetical protein